MNSPGPGGLVGSVFGGLNERRFLGLFLLLLFMFFGAPLLSGEIVAAFPVTAKLLYLVLFFAVLIGMVSITKPRRNLHHVMVGGSAIALLFNIGYLYWQSEALLIVNHALIAAILSYVIASLTRYLFVREDVSQYTLYAALCAYLLIGLLWVMLYGIADMLDPGCFRIPQDIAPDGRMASLGVAESLPAFYFSMVTLTTLGYGDIAPISQKARTLCSLEALVGQMFIAITIARLVGMYAAQRTEKKNGG